MVQGEIRGGLLGSSLRIPMRPRVFVSYHHAGDQWFYDEFSRMFHEEYEVFQDCSVERTYESDNVEYIRWSIANNDIKGTSCSIVLCGAQTYQRKYVDWEIKATLDDKHGLIGVCLPTVTMSQQGNAIVPSRLHENIRSGFALWRQWTALSAANLAMWINQSRLASRDLIVNPHEIKQRNG